MIEVQRTRDGDPLEFAVRVGDASGEKGYRVTLQRETAERLCPDQPAEVCVEAAFRFLLDREPKEQIMASFDVTVISRYFPDFEDRLPEYLEGGSTSA